MSDNVADLEQFIGEVAEWLTPRPPGRLNVGAKRRRPPKGVRPAGPNNAHAWKVRLQSKRRAINQAQLYRFGEVAEWLKAHAWKVCIR